MPRKDSSSNTRTKRGGGRKRPGKKRPTLAQRADKYDLYQQSVQEPEHEVAFFDRVYKAEFGARPMTLREDFCGTHAICCQWVKRRPGRRAIGVDLDPEPLAWGVEHNQVKLSENERRRITLIKGDVREDAAKKADIVAAENFSYFIFKTRDELRRYFEAARRNLNKRGLLVLDMMGGYETLEEDHEDERNVGRFEYIWEQRRFDPITHDITCVIHFNFPDHSSLKDVFHYDWRLWTIPEVREVLAEAGFSRSDVYWEGTDSKTGEGNDIYRKREHAESDPAWVAYVVGVKG